MFFGLFSASKASSFSNPSYLELSNNNHHIHSDSSYNMPRCVFIQYSLLFYYFHVHTYTYIFWPYEKPKVPFWTWPFQICISFIFLYITSFSISVSRTFVHFYVHTYLVLVFLSLNIRLLFLFFLSLYSLYFFLLSSRYILPNLLFICTPTVHPQYIYLSTQCSCCT